MLVLIIAALVVTYIRQQKEEFNETKQQAYKQIITIYLAITKELNQEEKGDNKERVSYLTGLVLMLKVLIRGLEYDLRLDAFDQETE